MIPLLADKPRDLVTSIAFLSIMTCPPLLGVWITEAPRLWPVTTMISTVSAILLARLIRPKMARVTFGLIVLNTIFLVNAAFFASYYLQNRGFNHAFFYHARPDLIHAGLGEFASMAALLVGALFLVNVLTILSEKAPAWPRGRALLAGSVSLVFIGSLVASPPALSLAWHFHPEGMADMTALLAGKKAEKPPVIPNAKAILTDLAARPRLASGQPRKKPPHVILIYLESVEQRYFDPGLFPNLLPKLAALRERSIDFPRLIQGKGTGWTIAGMAASQCGYPLLSSFRASGNDLGILPTFMPDATCFGDLLNEAGYTLAFMGGADHRFAGKGNFYRSHGFSRVAGFDDVEERLPDPSYRHYWGLFDDSLFDLAFDEFLSLAESGKPTGLVLLTLDTHHPEGYPSASCAPYTEIDNEILQAVHCTDQLASAFVERIRQSPYSDDTYIVIASDHLAMRNTAFTMLNEPGDERRLTFFVNAPDQIGNSIDSSGMHYDIAPTLLDLLDIPITGQLGFGRSLLRQDGYLTSMMGAKIAKEALPGKDLRKHMGDLWSLAPMNVSDGLSVDVEEGLVTFGGRDFDLMTKRKETLLPTLFSFDDQRLQLTGLYQAAPGEPAPDELTAKIRNAKKSIHLAIGPYVSVESLIEDLRADGVIHDIAVTSETMDDQDLVIFMGKAHARGIVIHPRSETVDLSADEITKLAR